MTVGGFGFMVGHTVIAAEPVCRACKVHTVSLSSFSCFPAVAPSNQPFSLLFAHLLQLFVPANSSSKLCLSIDKIILCFKQLLVVFAASSCLGVNMSLRIHSSVLWHMTGCCAHSATKMLLKARLINHSPGHRDRLPL